MLLELPPDLNRARTVLGQVVTDLDPTSEPASEPGDKTQTIRLADVFLFGPLMVYAALDKRPPPWMKAAMLAIGVGTIFYNASNYLEKKKLQ